MSDHRMLCRAFKAIPDQFTERMSAARCGQVRAKKACLTAYQEVHWNAGIDPRTDIIDLLADLRHLCDKLDLDFAALDEMAAGHYLSELSPLLSRTVHASASPRDNP